MMLLIFAFFTLGNFCFSLLIPLFFVFHSRQLLFFSINSLIFFVFLCFLSSVLFRLSLFTQCFCFPIHEMKQLSKLHLTSAPNKRKQVKQSVCWLQFIKPRVALLRGLVPRLLIPIIDVYIWYITYINDLLFTFAWGINFLLHIHKRKRKWRRIQFNLFWWLLWCWGFLLGSLQHLATMSAQRSVRFIIRAKTWKNASVIA